MLTDSEFAQWCHRLQLLDSARQEIQIIRTSEPKRCVGGRKNNVSGRYPSRKMGFIIQFESHKVELPFIYQLEHDENVLEYYDQPNSFKINCQSSSGRNLGFYITPDFFIIRNDGFEWVECKAEQQWQKLAQDRPLRYFLDENNCWRSPPAEQYAIALGGNFRLWSSAEINWTLQRNLEFLEDYYRHSEIQLHDANFNTITSLVSAQPGISLAYLLHHATGVTSDDIYNLVAQEKIYVNLTEKLLVETENCLLFPDQITAQAYNALISSLSTTSINSPVIPVTPGTLVAYNSIPLIISLVGETDILLQTQEKQAIEFDKETFDNLVRQGKITTYTKSKEFPLTSQIIEKFLKASVEDLEKANQRYRLLKPYLNGQQISANTSHQRSLYNWLAAYRQAQRLYGYGYIGLIYLNQSKGNRLRKLPSFLLEIIDKFISFDYETLKQKSKRSVYNDFVSYCTNALIPDDKIPSYKTLLKEINKRSGYEQTLKREGSRAAYPLSPFYWELEQNTPAHGDFPFHIGHIDHTELDLELRCSKTGKQLGRAWMTLLMDAFSRRILAVYITYDPPSYRSCMMVLRICVQRHGRLPQVIVTDNGKEFHSTYFETLLALFECTLKHRPSAKARFGSVCERLFGTTNTVFVYNLAGNTQITKKVRLMTQSVNPKNLALWTLGMLYLYLCEWAYEVYDTLSHPAHLGQNPREAFIFGQSRCGNRDHRRIPYDNNFRILTLPTTNKGCALVQPGKGIKIEHKYYWCTAFRDPEIEKTLVDVRYDPFNAGLAYAYVRGLWVQCISEYYNLFQGRSEKEIQLATAELNKQKRNLEQNYKIRAKQLGQFLASLEAEEILLSQRQKDEQLLEVFRIIDGNFSSLNPQNEFRPRKPENDHLENSQNFSPSDDSTAVPQHPELFERY